MVAVTAFARTGGGSHAAAASHSDGGSFGSGGSLGGLIGLLILILLVGYILRRVRNSSSGQALGGSPQAQAAIATLGSVIGASNLAKIALGDLGSGGSAAFRRPLPPGLDAIRALDPGFEMETFLQRAEMTFFLVKRGVQKNDAAAIRPYLNDGVFNAVSQGIAQSKAQHRRALLESLNVRGLAVTGETRWHDLPDIPTMAEAGFPDFVFETYTALLAPAKTPPEIVARLEKETLAILARPEMRERLVQGGFQVQAKDGKGHMARVAREVPMYRNIIAQAKIEKLR